MVRQSAQATTELLVNGLTLREAKYSLLTRKCGRARADPPSCAEPQDDSSIQLSHRATSRTRTARTEMPTRTVR